jgi:hypothetical protein
MDGYSLERRGDLAGAARAYAAEGRAADAARLWVKLGQHAEAAQVLLAALSAEGRSLAALPLDRRRQAYTAAVLHAHLGRIPEAHRLFLGVGEPESAARLASQAAGRARSVVDLDGVLQAERLQLQGDGLGAAAAFLDARAPERAARLFLENGRFGLALNALLTVSPAHPDYRWAAAAAVGIAERQRDLHPGLATFLASFVATGPVNGEVSVFERLRSLYRQHGFPEEAAAVSNRLEAAELDGGFSGRTPLPRSGLLGDQEIAAGVRIESRYRLENLVPARGPDAWHARDLATGNVVCVEFLGMVPAQLGVTPDERIARNLDLLGRLQHPNLVRTLDAGVFEGRWFMVTEAIEGEPLLSRLEDGLGLAEALDALRALAEALAHAHSQGVLHRRIAAGQLLWAEDGPRLVGLGATLFDEALGPAITPERARYLAPEEVTGLGRVTFRADLYAFGAVAYHLLTGQPVIADQDPEALLFAALTREPTPLRALDPALPERLERVVMRLLAKAPEQRYESAEAVAMELAAVRAALP